MVIGTWFMAFWKKNCKVVCDVLYDVFVSINNKNILGPTCIYLFF